MSRPRLPFTHKETSRGQTFWYYRRGHGLRTRLKGVYGGAEFLASYRAANADKAASARRMRGEGTFEWLWNLYLASPSWTKLSAATKKQRLNLMRLALKRAGNQPIERWDRKFIVASCDARAETPAQARNFLGALRSLFQWALTREHVDADPTRDVKVKRLRGDGFHTWTAAEMKAFEERWPLGTRERLAYDLMLWTGLRRGDAASIGPQHVIDGAIVIKTAKTGAEVSMRILPPLMRSIAATPCGRDSFVAGVRGAPMVKEGFGNWFGEACRAAGVKGSAHGLRKALAVKLSEAGATDSEINSILGNELAALYRRKANKRRLAGSAFDRLFPNGTPDVT